MIYNEEWMTLADAATRWHIGNPDSLRVYVHRGTLAARKSGHIWLVAISEMERMFGPEKPGNLPP